MRRSGRLSDGRSCCGRLHPWHVEKVGRFVRQLDRRRPAELLDRERVGSAVPGFGTRVSPRKLIGRSETLPSALPPGSISRLGHRRQDWYRRLGRRKTKRNRAPTAPVASRAPAAAPLPSWYARTAEVETIAPRPARPGDGRADRRSELQLAPDAASHDPEAFAAAASGPGDRRCGPAGKQLLVWLGPASTWARSAHKPPAPTARGSGGSGPDGASQR